jgi:hypothetical protein
MTKFFNFLLKSNPVAVIIWTFAGLLDIISNKSRDYKDDSDEQYNYNRHKKKPIKVDLDDAGSCIISFNDDIDRPCTISKYDTL